MPLLQPRLAADNSGHLLTISGQGAEGRLFILAHEAAIAVDIGTEDRRKLALHTHFSPEAITLPAPPVRQAAQHVHPHPDPLPQAVEGEDSSFTEEVA